MIRAIIWMRRRPRPCGPRRSSEAERRGQFVDKLVSEFNVPDRDKLTEVLSVAEWHYEVGICSSEWNEQDAAEGS